MIKIDIETLKDNMRLIEGIIPSYTKGMEKGFSYVETEKRVNKALEDIYSLLDLMTPKRSLGEEDEEYICPNCEDELIYDYYNITHCEMCGQVIDWEGED